MYDVKKDLFEQLYNRYHNMAYRFILSKVKDPWTAEDLLSEVFMKIYKHREEINDINKSGSWIIRIANNTIIDFFRKNGKIKFEDEDEIICEPVYEKGYDQVFIRDEYKTVIQNLPVEIKKLLAMRFLQELKFKEIGQLMNLPEVTAKNRVYKALRTAREIYNYQYAEQ
ncbi:MAG: sigma-70 family RNA polymerase sigma factor [Bacillota bacterium]|nr:sigma-70 family RNA polymerase sigma factor [Bacillota bacterium]